MAALIDLGVDAEKISAELSKLKLDGWRLKISKDSRGGVFGTRVDVEVEDAHDAHSHKEHPYPHKEHGHSHGEKGSHAAHAHRKFSEIAEMIGVSGLSVAAKKNALAIFRNLAEAEAMVHQKDISDVAFHEVGAVDSIIDIVGAAVAAELLGADRIVSSAVELGGGTVKCAHGILPVPAPATALLSKKFPSKIGGANHECTTPTGAAIIASLCDGYCEKISGTLIATGIGIGHRDFDGLPNFLRVLLYETDSADSSAKTEAVRELSANIDDMTGEHISELCSKLFAAGALDVWQEPIFMKKNRAGTKVSVLCRDNDAEKIRACFFRHSSTLGVREAQLSRTAILRAEIVKETRFGMVRFKKSEFGAIARLKPEFEDCRKISEDTGIPIDIITKEFSNG